LHQLRRGVSLFGHAQERGGGEPKPERRGFLFLRVLHLHIIELVHTWAEDVVRDPPQGGSENHQKHKRTAVEPGDFGDFHGGRGRLLRAQG